MSTKKKSLIFGVSATSIALLIFPVYSALSIGVCAYLLYYFIEKLNYDLTIIDLLLLLAALQWLLGPVLEYYYEIPHYKYFMYVDQKTYMNYVLPGTLAMIIGAKLINTRIDVASYLEVIGESIKSNPRVPYILIAIGLMSDIAMNFFPPSLRFVIFLMSQFKYIGSIYLILGTSRYKWYFVFSIIFLSLVSSIINGMFHNFILWSTLLFTIISMVLDFKTYQKLIIISIGFIFMITLQIIKAQYRDVVKMGISEQDRVEVFIDLFSEEILNGINLDNEENLKSIITRLNQGWIVSAIMRNVPENEKFANGETIKVAIWSTLVPRFIDKDKKIAGGRENFMKYTGLPLTLETSMGISVIGEAYINFGVYGGILFMFVYGLGMALLFKLFITLSITKPSLILWSPLLFLQAVKAETELVVILNHVIKSGILVLLFIYVTQRFLGWKY